MIEHSTKKLLGLSVAMFGILLALYAAWILLDLPREETLIPIANEFFQRYGLITVLISATLEGLLLVGWYFPGSLVIVLGLILAGHDVLRLAQVATMAATGLCTAYLINFFVGKYGWFRLLLALGLKEPLEKAQSRLAKYGVGAIFATYWQANLASLTSTAAGVLRLPFVTFLLASIGATVLWITFWSTLIYFLGAAAMTLVNLRYVLIAIALWIAGRLIWRAIAILRTKRLQRHELLERSRD